MKLTTRSHQVAHYAKDVRNYRNYDDEEDDGRVTKVFQRIWYSKELVIFIISKLRTV